VGGGRGYWGGWERACQARARKLRWAQHERAMEEIYGAS
jgi:hypothetical protein